MLNKFLNCKTTIFISLFAYFALAYVNQSLEIILLVVLLGSMLYVGLNKTVKFNYFDLFVTIAVLLVYCFRNLFFNYSFYFLLNNFYGVVKYLLFMAIVVLSFPFVYRIVYIVGIFCNRILNEKPVDKKIGKVFFWLLTYRLIVRTVIKHIINIELLKSIDSFIIVSMTIYGLIYALNRLFKHKNGKIFVSLNVMLVFFYISIFYNMIFVDMDCFYLSKHLMLNLAFCVFILYPLGEWIGGKKKFDEIASYIRPILYIWSFGIVVVLIKIYFNLNIECMSGVYYTDCLYMNDYYNMSARQIAIFIFIALYLLPYDKKPLFKIIDCLTIVLNYFVLILSNSRGAYLGALICFALAVMIIIYNKTNKLALSLAIGVLSGGAFHAFREFPFYLYSAIIVKENMMCADSSLNMIGIFNRNSEGFRGFDQDNAGTLNGRTEIWKYSIIGFLTDIKVFLFGVTEANIHNFIVEASNGIRTDLNTHNLILEVACSSGIFTFIPYMFYLIDTGLRCLFSLVKKTTFQLQMFAIVLIFIAISYMVEASFIYGEHLCGYVFFILSAILIENINLPKIKK